MPKAKSVTQVIETKHHLKKVDTIESTVHKMYPT